MVVSSVVSVGKGYHEFACLLGYLQNNDLSKYIQLGSALELHSPVTIGEQLPVLGELNSRGHSPVRESRQHVIRFHFPTTHCCQYGQCITSRST